VASLDQSAPLDVRVNTLGDKRDGVRQELALAGIGSRPTPYSPWGLRLEGKPALTRLDAFARGAIEVQDEARSCWPCSRTHGAARWWSTSAPGPGGKTLALGAMMRSTGRLYAFDVSAHRLENLKPRLARSKLSNVHPAAIAHERDERIKRLAARSTGDRGCAVLRAGHAAPQSGPEVAAVAASPAELAAKQAAILESAARLLKTGGRIVYAPAACCGPRTRDVAAAFTAAHPGFRRLLVRELLESARVGDSSRLCGADGQDLRLWPQRHGTDGFYAAAWEKVQS
jgi:16S rRNA (cytosine967-C5)-methyltransferase